MVKLPTPDHHHVKRRFSLFGVLRNNFLAGLVVIAPIGLTVWLILTVIGWIDGFVWPFVPEYWHPDVVLNRWFGDPETGRTITVNVRGIGVILFLVFTIVVGWVAKGLVGRSFLRWGESLVDRMPVVRSIYNGAKQIAETVFAQSDKSFDKACLIEHPRKGVYAIAFISTSAKGEILEKLGAEDDIVTVFMPTTPNPTSGFLLFLPRREVILLDMTVEDAAKLVISAGLVYPPQRDSAGEIIQISGAAE
jgi:uncharacterized membrane protein